MKYLKLYEGFLNNIFFGKDKTLQDYINNGRIKINVEVLDCYNLLINSLDGIEKFTNLKYLRCQGNCLESLQNIKNLINLVEIDCRGNNLRNLKGIENLINLEGLYCTDNLLTSLDGIENLNNLRSITFDERFIKHPTKLPNLLHINTTYNKNLIEKFKSYECQKEFLIKFPNKFDVLIPYGIHAKIKEEFPALVRGSEWGFFDLKNDFSI